MKNHPIFWTVLAVIAVIVTTGAVFMAYTQSQLDHLSQNPIQDADLTKVADGTYTGYYSAFPVTVKLTVTVKDHVITEITILKHDNGQGKPAEAILDEVIAHQSLEVDVIAGATYSSKVILKALQDALN